jgi:poly-gamma-glutamate synthesis protein (capsule biosynthesis protein)
MLQFKGNSLRAQQHQQDRRAETARRSPISTLANMDEPDTGRVVLEPVQEPSLYAETNRGACLRIRQRLGIAWTRADEGQVNPMDSILRKHPAAASFALPAAGGGASETALDENPRKHWRWALAGLIPLIAIGVALLPTFIGRHSAAAVVLPYPHDLAQVTFAVAGDVIPHEAVKQSAAAAGDGELGWAAQFSDVADVFEGTDFGFVNMETPVAPANSHGTKAFLFDAPVALPQALKASGIKIVSFANNHVMDQGWAGFTETRVHLKETGLLFAGTSDNAATAWQPVFTEANGIKVGWLGMTRWLNGNRNPDKDDQPHVNFYPYPGEANGAPGADEATVLNAVKAARAQCDLLVISVHWGIEYATAPRPEDVDLAHKMLDAGASVVVGGHPHVLQPIETYQTKDGRDTVIFYSMGNFLSNQSRAYVEGLNPDSNGEPRDEMIGLFSAVKRDYGPAGVRPCGKITTATRLRRAAKPNRSSSPCSSIAKFLRSRRGSTRSTSSPARSPQPRPSPPAAQAASPFPPPAPPQRQPEVTRSRPIRKRNSSN